MASKLTTIIQDLERFNKERKLWLLISSFVTLAILAIGLEWNKILSGHAVWAIVFTTLSISAVWWYWTMRIVKTVIQHRHQEVEILHDLIIDIREIKKEVNNLMK
jgi:hypothetical protein